MLVGFKRQFAPFVREGSKRHTIRGQRRDGKVPSIGEVLHCYSDPRQKTMELLGRWPCSGVEEILIIQVGDSLQLTVAGRKLDPSEAALFLWRDGFREWMAQSIPEGHLIALTAANYFWLKRLKESGGRWAGNLIHWAYDMPFVPTKGRRISA